MSLVEIEKVADVALDVGVVSVDDPHFAWADSIRPQKPRLKNSKNYKAIPEMTVNLGLMTIIVAEKLIESVNGIADRMNKLILRDLMIDSNRAQGNLCGAALH